MKLLHIILGIVFIVSVSGKRYHVLYLQHHLSKFSPIVCLILYTFDLTGKDIIPADANQSLQVSSRGKSKTVQHLRATPRRDQPPIHEVTSHGDAIHTTKFIEQEQMEGISATARRRLGRRRKRSLHN